MTIIILGKLCGVLVFCSFIVTPVYMQSECYSSGVCACWGG